MCLPMIGLKELPRGDQMWMTRVIESKSAVSNWLCLTQCHTAVADIIMSPSSSSSCSSDSSSSSSSCS